MCPSVISLRCHNRWGSFTANLLIRIKIKGFFHWNDCKHTHTHRHTRTYIKHICFFFFTVDKLAQCYRKWYQECSLLVSVNYNTQEMSHNLGGWCSFSPLNHRLQGEDWEHRLQSLSVSLSEPSLHKGGKETISLDHKYRRYLEPCPWWLKRMPLLFHVSEMWSFYPRWRRVREPCWGWGGKWLTVSITENSYIMKVNKIQTELIIKFEW